MPSPVVLLLLFLAAFANAGDICGNCTSFKIGVGVDQFLRYKPQDTLIMHGVEYWVKWMNDENGGIMINGALRPVEMIVRDINVADATKTAVVIGGAYQKLIDEDHCDIVVSPYATPRIAPAAAVAEARQTINFIIGATELAVKPNFNSTVGWIFNSMALGNESLYLIAKKAKSFLVVTGVDTLTPIFGLGAAHYLTDHGLENFGITKPNTTLSADNSGLATPIRAAIAAIIDAKGTPDVIVAAFLQDQFQYVIEAIEALKPKVKALVSINAGTRTFFKDNKINVDPNYWITVTGFDKDLGLGTSGQMGGNSAEYNTKFKALFKEDPDSNAALTTSALMAFTVALNKANSLKVTDIMHELKSAPSQQFMGGNFKLNANGVNVQTKLYAFQYVGKNAPFVDENTVVYPGKFSWLAKDDKRTTVIVSVTVSVSVVVLIALVLGVFYVRKQRQEVVSVLAKTEEGERRAYKLDFNAMELGPLLGSGSFGHVYSGVYRGADVAIKKLKHQNMSKKQLDDFAKEAATMVGLRHPNIVLFMGVCLEPNRLCIVTEMMSRGSLQDVLSSKTPISVGLIQQMALDMLKGLQFIHSTGLIHRDLKSPNLLVDSNWRIKIADFGLSCGKAQSDDDEAQVSLLWTAPEILMKEKNCYTDQSDVYSFGIILWEMFSRSIPFMGKTPAFIHKAVVRGERPEINPTWPQEYVRIMKKCWDPRAYNRPTVKQVREMIEAIPPEEGADGDYMHASYADVAPQGPIAVVVCNVKHADELWQENPRAMYEAMYLHNREMRRLIEQFNGYEVKSYYQYFLIVFSDPIKAVNFCMKAQEDLMAAPWPEEILQSTHACEEKSETGSLLYRGFRVGMGINFGAPLAKRDNSTNKTEYSGPVFAQTLKMADLVEGGHILITSYLYSRVMSQTSRVEPFQIESAGSVNLSGMTELASVFEIMPKCLEDRLSYVVPLEALHTNDAVLLSGGGALKKTGSSQKSLNDPRFLFSDSIRNEKWHIAFRDIHMLQQVGIGIFGEVHVANYNGNKVAVRTLLKQKEHELGLLEMRKDITILTKLSHPNIIKYFGVCIEVPHMGIVMEYCEKGSLGATLYNTSINLTWEQRKRYALDVARGMEYLHRNDIIHRDCKSTNMLINQSSTVVVSDFGFYALKEESQTMTQAGVVAYTAPEVFNGEEYTKACDVYSYGILLWEIVFRQKPWGGLHAMKVINAVSNSERPSLNIPVDAPAAVKDIIQACWHPNPASRITFDAVVEQLSHL